MCAQPQLLDYLQGVQASSTSNILTVTNAPQLAAGPPQSMASTNDASDVTAQNAAGAPSAAPRSAATSAEQQMVNASFSAAAAADYTSSGNVASAVPAYAPTTSDLQSSQSHSSPCSKQVEIPPRQPVPHPALQYTSSAISSSGVSCQVPVLPALQPLAPASHVRAAEHTEAAQQAVNISRLQSQQQPEEQQVVPITPQQYSAACTIATAIDQTTQVPSKAAAQEEDKPAGSAGTSADFIPYDTPKRHRRPVVRRPMVDSDLSDDDDDDHASDIGDDQPDTSGACDELYGPSVPMST